VVSRTIQSNAAKVHSQAFERQQVAFRKTDETIHFVDQLTTLRVKFSLTNVVFFATLTYI